MQCTLAIVPLLFVSDGVLCEFAMVPDMYILLFPQEEEVHSFFLTAYGERCKNLAPHSQKHFKLVATTLLLCQGNSSKNHGSKIIALSLVLLV